MRLLFFCVFVTIQAYGQGIDSLRSNSSTTLLDSLRHINNNRLASVSTLKDDKGIKLDSINPQQRIIDHPQKLNVPLSNLRSRIDSLNPPFVHNALISLDFPRIKRQLDSIDNSTLPATFWRPLERAEDLAQEVSSKIDSIGSNVNRKLSVLSKNGGSIPVSVNLPATNLQASHDVDDLNIERDLAHSEIDPPQFKGPPRNLAPNIGVNDGGSGELPGLSDPKLKEIKALPGVNRIQRKLGEVSEAGNEVKGHREDLTELQEGDLAGMQELPDVIESKVQNMDEIKSLEKSSEAFAAIKAKWNDPEVLKEQALNKAKEGAVNHFAGQEDKLKAAMEKLSKLKAKIPDPQGTIDLFAKRQQFISEKKLIERFVPGFAFQFQKQESYWLDLNPYVGFKVTGRWLAGLGWNERLAYNFDERDWDKENRIYGVRSFVHFKLKTSIWLKSDVEYMNAPIYATPLMTSEAVGRDWIWSFFAGFKKDMEISKRFKATVQTLYNIYNPDKRNPYPNRLNIRIGFEMKIKKGR